MWTIEKNMAVVGHSHWGALTMWKFWSWMIKSGCLHGLKSQDNCLTSFPSDRVLASAAKRVTLATSATLLWVIVNWCLTLIRSNFPVDCGKGLTVVWITVLAYWSYLYHFSFFFCSRRTIQSTVVISVCVCLKILLLSFISYQKHILC